MNNEKIVMFDSDEAAQHVSNISGWVSRTGQFFGNDERAARYDGCTHRLCEDCGLPAPKSFVVCHSCGQKRDVERYKKLERRRYERGMVYSDSLEKFFDSLDDALGYAEEEGTDPADLRLLICEPNYARLDADLFRDSLPDDSDGPPNLEEAIRVFNETMRGVVLSWSSSGYAVEL